MINKILNHLFFFLNYIYAKRCNIYKSKFTLAPRRWILKGFKGLNRNWLYAFAELDLEGYSFLRIAGIPTSRSHKNEIGLLTLLQ